MKKKQFKFVYSFDEYEPPEAFYLQSNNVTNATIEWEKYKKSNDILLAIFCDNEKVFENENVKTNYRLEHIK